VISERDELGQEAKTSLEEWEGSIGDTIRLYRMGYFPTYLKTTTKDQYGADLQ